MLGGDPHKAELIFKQNQLPFDVTMIFEAPPGHLSLARESTKFPFSLLANEVNGWKCGTIMRFQAGHEGNFAPWHIQIAGAFGSNYVVTRVGDIDDLRSMAPAVAVVSFERNIAL